MFARNTPILMAVALFSGALIASPVGAQEGNVENGAELAAEFCVQCHDVTATGPMKQHPPAFAAVARFRPEEQIRASIWFPALRGHLGMPQVRSVLSRDAVNDLTAYIVSLE